MSDETETQTPEERRAQEESNLRTIMERLDAVEGLTVTEANLSVLSRSKKGTHKAAMWFDIPECDGLRSFANIIMPLHIYLDSLHVLCRQRLEAMGREDQMAEFHQDYLRGDADPEDLLDQIFEWFDDLDTDEETEES